MSKAARKPRSSKGQDKPASPCCGSSAPAPAAPPAPPPAAPAQPDPKPEATAQDSAPR